MKLRDQIRFKQDEIIMHHEGWLRIASSGFNNIKRFPSVPDDRHQQFLGQKEEDIVHQEEHNHGDGVFRHNSKFNSKDHDVPTLDSFYVRLSGLNLFYTETEEDLIVLGTIALKNIQATADGMEASCFRVIDQENDNWDLCDPEGKSPHEWVCAISEQLGMPCDLEPKDITHKVFVKQPIMIIPVPSPDCARDWNYNLHGSNWICRCNEGSQQSPIDLPHINSSCLKELPRTATFEYPKVGKNFLNVVYETNMMRIKKRFDFINLGTLCDVDGTEYDVTEIQFHTPAEHKINGETYDMEMQVIHKAKSGEMKQKAVFSVLYTKDWGSKLKGFDNLDILNLPNPLNKLGNNIVHDDLTILDFTNIKNNGGSPNFNYYKYRGSFTSPPCEEDVIWIIKAEPVPLGPTVITFINEVLSVPEDQRGGLGTMNMNFNDNYEGSNRNIQPINNRDVWYYDANKGFNTNSDSMSSGHFEKITEELTKYFFVPGNEHSGIKGATIMNPKRRRLFKRRR